MIMSLSTKTRSPSDLLFHRTHTNFFLKCLLLPWWWQPSLGLPLITATIAVAFPSGELFLSGVLLLTCISFALIDDAVVMLSSVIIVAK